MIALKICPLLSPGRVLFFKLYENFFQRTEAGDSVYKNLLFQQKKQKTIILLFKIYKRCDRIKTRIIISLT